MKIIILAGGSGNRLWPLSRPSFPKQFLKFGQEHSLLEKTLLRFLREFSPQDLVLITQKEMFDHVKSGAAKISPELTKRIIIEPEARNTAPAILFALKWLEEKGELDDCFLVAPSDHLISPEEEFLEKVKLGEKIALQGHHITFGVYPTHPHTGYGYIQYSGDKEVSSVDCFIEKPSLTKAQSLLAGGHCLWNAGIFIFHTSHFLSELQEYQPAMATAFAHNLEKSYAHLPSLSIDYAFIEYSENLKVIPLQLSWSDVGSWDNVFDALATENEVNVKTGNVLDVDTSNCLIFGEKRLVATLDVEDLIIVDTEDAVLVAKRGSSQKIRLLVDKLKETGAREVKEHRTTYRPWGSYTILEEGERYKIKRIVVEPGQKLSLQYHLHRSEHWVIIKGEAKIVLGEEELQLRENESLFVPKETVHRLQNATENLLEIIEVQVGDYVGEDDIIRLEDIYGRLEPSLSNN